MKKLKQTTKILAMISTVVLLYGTAHAATLVTSDTFGDSLPAYQETLTFDQFDESSWGTLTGINIELTINTSGGTLAADNDSVSSGLVTFELGADGEISSSDVWVRDGSFNNLTANVFTTTTQSLVATTGDSTSQYDNTGLGDHYSYAGGSNSNSNDLDVDLGYWTWGNTGYKGTGTYDITLDTTQYTKLTGLGGLSSSTSPVTAGGTVTITYTYTPLVPEPATIALFGVGLISVAGISRKKLIKT